MRELRRIFLDPRRWLILLLTAAVNLALFAGYCRTIPAPTEEEQKEYAAYIAECYCNYLDRVSRQSDEQSLLSTLRPTDYVTRNLEKTRADYAELRGITVTAGENRGILAVTEHRITDYLLAIVPLLLVIAFAAERKTELTALLRTAKNGRTVLTLWRLLAAALTAAVSVLVLYGSNLIFAHEYFGEPGYTRSLQSIPAFQLCSQRVTVGGYLLRAGLMKACAVWLIAMTVWLLWGLFHTAAAVVCTGGFFGAQWLCFRLILPTSGQNPLKFCNLFAMLSPETFFLRYANLSIFGKPCGFLRCMLTTGAIFGTVCILLCVLLLGHMRPVTFGSSAGVLLEKLSAFRCRFLRRHTRFGYEGRKLLISQGGILVLCAGLCYGIHLVQTVRVDVPVSYELRTLYSKFEGPATPEKRAYCQEKIDWYAAEIAKKEKKLDAVMQSDEPDLSYVNTLQNEISELQYKMNLYQAFQDRMNALLAYTAETGHEAWLVRQNGWNALFRQTPQARRCSTALLIVLVFLFAPFLAYENRAGTVSLLRSLRYGRGSLTRCRAGWTLLLTLLCAAGFHAVYLAALAKTGMLVLPEAPLHSIDLLRFVPFSGSLRPAAAALYFLRYLAAVAIAAAILLISRISRHPQSALLAALSVFLLPAALAELGMPVPDPVRLLCLSIG